MSKTKYNPTDFGMEIQGAISREMMAAVSCGYTKNEAAIVVAQVAISSALGFTTAALGKGRPTQEDVRKLTNKIIDLVSDLPPSA